MHRLLIRSLCLLAVLALAAALVACSKTPENLPGFSAERPEVGQAEKAFLLKAVRAGLAAGGAIDAAGAPATLTRPYGNGAIVAAFVPGHKFFLEMSRGDSVLDAVQRATRKIAEDARFERVLSSTGLDNAVIKVDVVDQVFPIERKSLRRMRYEVEPGLFGLILVNAGKEFYQAPEELIYRGWYMEGEARMNGTRCIEKQLRMLARQAGLADEGWKDDPVALYRFSTISFKEQQPGGAPQDLFRGNVLYPRELTTTMVLDSVYQTGRCLSDYMDENGKFRYIYWPDSDTVAENYSVVRHAGAVWGLFRLYRLFGDKAFLDAAQNGLSFMRENLIVPPENPDIVLFAPDGQASSGGQALALLTYLEIPDALMTDKLRQELYGFGNALLAFTEQDGRVYKSWDQVVNKKMPSEQPIYFPGESMLALIRFYERTKEPRWLECAKRIGDFQTKEFRSKGAPDNWVIQAMSRLYRIEPKDEYRELAFAMADYNVFHQHPRARGYSHQVWDDYVGGFDNSTPPRSTPAGSRTEATDEAYELAVFINDQAAIERYGQTIYDAIWFDINQMFRPETAYFLPYPEKALGCMRGSPVANDTRIDYNQHVFVAFLGGFNVVYKAELERNQAAGKPAPQPLTWKIPLWPGEVGADQAPPTQPAAATTPAAPASEVK